MRVHVVYDGQGNIVSITESPIAGAGQNSSQPLAGEGQTVAELDVPAEQSHLSLHGIAQRLRIDIQAARPTFVASHGGRRAATGPQATTIP